MALRTGIAPSELMQWPEVYAAIVDELIESDEATARANRQQRLKEQLR